MCELLRTSSLTRRKPNSRLLMLSESQECHDPINAPPSFHFLVSTSWEVSYTVIKWAGQFLTEVFFPTAKLHLKVYFDQNLLESLTSLYRWLQLIQALELSFLCMIGQWHKYYNIHAPYWLLPWQRSEHIPTEANRIHQRKKTNKSRNWVSRLDDSSIWWRIDADRQEFSL